MDNPFFLKVNPSDGSLSAVCTWRDDVESHVRSVYLSGATENYLALAYTFSESVKVLNIVPLSPGLTGRRVEVHTTPRMAREERTVAAGLAAGDRLITLEDSWSEGPRFVVEDLGTGGVLKTVKWGRSLTSLLSVTAPDITSMLRFSYNSFVVQNMPGGRFLLFLKTDEVDSNQSPASFQILLDVEEETISRLLERYIPTYLVWLGGWCLGGLVELKYLLKTQMERPARAICSPGRGASLGR